MATVQESADDGNRVTCDLPACKLGRAQRGQANGRWLCNVKFGQGTVSVTSRCYECGGVHTVVFQVPQSTS